MLISEEMSKKIQICRAVGIIGVVIIHSLKSTNIEDGVVRLFVNFSVALFIFLSVFLTKDDISISKIKNRLLRVLLPYLFWSLIYVIVSHDYNNLIFKFLIGQCCSIYYYIFVYVQLTIFIPIFIKIMNNKWWKCLQWHELKKVILEAYAFFLYFKIVG